MTRVGDALFGADREVAAWVGARIPHFALHDGQTAIGVVKEDRLVAGAVYERWNGVHVEASIAAEPGARWADRRTLHALFHYPFVTLGCLALTALVPSSNPVSLNLVTKMGFEPEALIRYAAWDGSTLIAMKMLRERCRWIGAEEWTAAGALPPQG